MNKKFSNLFLLNLILTPILFTLIATTFMLGGISTFLLGVLYILMVFFSGLAAFMPEAIGLTSESEVPEFFGTVKVVSLLLLIVLILPISKVIYINNKSVSYKNTYIKKTQELQGFYDNMWKTYVQKDSVAKINKETFVEISKIIMENRKDGSSVSWKWVMENQAIPFTEFSSFYKDLSSFIETQRQGYFNLEKERQNITMENNTMLQTFPNNIYKMFTGASNINYEYGFTSDSTTKVFNSKLENLK